MHFLLQGFCYPAVYTLLGVWAPPAERSTTLGISLGGRKNLLSLFGKDILHNVSYLFGLVNECLVGGVAGTVLGTPLSVYMAAKYGWPSVFYVIGALGISIGLVVVFLGGGSPATHMLISKSERSYIESSLGGPKVQVFRY